MQNLIILAQAGETAEKGAVGKIVETFGGVVCQPYYFRSASDDEMERIYGIISEFAETGESAQVGYRAATNGRPPTQE